MNPNTRSQENALKVEVYLYASLSKYLPFDQPVEQSGRSVMLEVDENDTISDIAALLNIPEKTIKLIFINGVHARMDTPVKNGDRIGLFPPVGGG